MSAVTGQPWFWPTVAVVIGLPLGLLLLGEAQGALARRDSAFAKPVGLLRNWLLPAGAAYLLVDQFSTNAELPAGDSAVAKVAATVVGFLIILVLLSGANAALFGEARSGTWRDRLPGIFIDLGRLLLIIVGIGLLLSWVWGANIGGLVAAIGVTSIVIGLAVQSAVGPVISGLLLLFEQPFRLGDWLDTKFGKGQVVEVNWRAVHLDTENGIQVVPNAALAGDPFVNLSRTTASYFKAKAVFSFASDDPPGLIRRTLMEVAEGLPARLREAKPLVIPAGTHSVHARTSIYKVLVPVPSPAEADGTASLLTQRVWYASQRAGLHLDGVKSGRKDKQAYLAEHLTALGAGFGLGSEATAAMLSGARLLPFAQGELVLSPDAIPEAVAFIAEGRVAMFVDAEDGRRLELGELGPGDFVGVASLTRQRAITGAFALSDCILVQVSRESMESVVRHDARLARRVGETIDIRRRAAREAIAEASRGLR
jgi:small-conductance mechanosensitive channel